MAYLIVERPDAPAAKVNLPGTMTIGRSKEAGIWVPDTRLSREHCRIEQRPDGWFIVDLGSSNGTRIDDKRVREMRLENNLQINVGDTVLTFRSGTLVQRPSNPLEARTPSAVAQKTTGANHGSTLTGTNFAKRVLPPEHTDAEKSVSPPLAFTRPPATPIVPQKKEKVAAPTDSGSSWIKSLIGRLSRH